MMTKRRYNGSPIDMTWNNGPWANDGETVDATEKAQGNMKTDDWPDNATPKEELNDDQIAVIKAAARNPDVSVMHQLTEIADLNDRSKNYANNVISCHWPKRKLKGFNNQVLSQKEIAQTRRMALNGNSTLDIANKFGVGQETARRAIKGILAFSDKSCSVPPLKYDKSIREWVIPKNSEKTEHKPNKPTTTDEVRHLLLEGWSVNEIVGEFGGDNSHYSQLARVQPDESEHNYPPLEFSRSPVQTWKPVAQPDPNADTETDDDQQQLDDNSDATPDADATPVPSRNNEPTPSNDSDANTRRIAIAAVALAVVALIRRWTNADQ